MGYIYLHICNNLEKQLHISNKSRNLQSTECVPLTWMLNTPYKVLSLSHLLRKES